MKKTPSKIGAHRNPRPGHLQSDVHAWLLAAMGSEGAQSPRERYMRNTEKTLELSQSLGATREEMHALVNYVFDRPIGDPVQEIGGQMVTLAALCAGLGYDMMGAARHEVDRISKPEVIAKIRKKQAEKPEAIKD